MAVTTDKVRFIKVSKTNSEAQTRSGSNGNSIYFNDGSSTINNKIFLNGKDYSGVKEVTVSASPGKIKVDGSDVNIQGWADLAPKASPSFTGTPTVPDLGVSASGTQIANKNYVDSKIAAADALVFKGTVGGEQVLPSTGYEVGWTYKVAVAGTYANKVCEVGDMLIAVKSYSASQASVDDWVVIQGNVDNAVSGPSSATNNNIAVFDNTTGKIIKDGGAKISSYDSETPVQINFTNASNTKVPTEKLAAYSFATRYHTGDFAGHFVGFDSSGNITDSTKRPSDFANAIHTHGNIASDGTHTHGNITNTGTIGGDPVNISDGDRLVIADNSNSNTIVKTNITFDGSTTTSFLSKKGTFETVDLSSKMDKTDVTVSLGTITILGTSITPKTVQTAKASPTTDQSDTALAFIDTITLDLNGVITATKKNISDVTTTTHGLMSSADKVKLNSIDANAQPHQAPTKAEINNALEASLTDTVRATGTADDTRYPTEAAVRTAITAAITTAVDAAGPFWENEN